MYYFLEALFLLGIAIIVLAGLWLLLRCWRSPRRLLLPVLFGLLGVAVMATPMIYTRVVETIDLGERERLVNGELHLSLTGWDRSGYDFLARKANIVVLQMANNDVDDATLLLLQGQSKLKTLDLNGSQVTDKGMEVLAGLKSLEQLRLRGTKVTDAGMQILFENLPDLRQLDLQETVVSRECIEAWKTAKPGRRVLKS
ncbi:MAG: hypothetical protein JNL67_22115 [Planctomycetaceae bacterium]|nr:hypothetical protein [Planctomycetaceae bacterium]